MELFKLEKMVKGWFIGDFSPSLLPTKDFEIACKDYKAGDYEEKHIHRISKEFTVITGGKVIMNGKHYIKGDIVVIAPGEATDFKAITDASTVVIKVPSVKGDKYPA